MPTKFKPYVLACIYLCATVLLTAQNNQDYINTLDKQIRDAFKKAVNGKTGKAIQIADAALLKSEAIKNDSLIADSYNVLGISFAMMNQKQKAITYFKKALNKYKDQGMQLDAIIMYNNIGLALQESNKLDEAEKTYKEALSIAKSDYNKTLLNINLGALNVQKSSYKEGITYLNKALIYAKKRNDSTNLALIHENLTASYLALKDTVRAKKHFVITKKIANKLKLNYIKYYLYKDVYDGYKIQNNTHNIFTITDSLLSVKNEIKKEEEYEIYKKIEAQYNLKDTNEKLTLIEKQKAAQRSLNMLLALFLIVLTLAIILVLQKNKQLKKEKIKTEILSKAKTKLYSEISHELRTPLYAVIELSNLLINENPKTEQKKYLESLNFSGNHLLSLINNILQFNKHEKKLIVQNNYFDLKKLISNIMESLKFSVKQQNNTIILEYDKQTPKLIKGDSLILSQIIINLLSNAIKFTNNGTITLKVKPLKKENDTTTLYFEVKDTGVGISKEKQKLVYEEFHQEKNQAIVTQAGSGLGLSIVYKLLKKLNSEIHLESTLNKGATFSFNLDFDYNVNNQYGKIELLDNIKYLKDYKILVVDDNNINLMISKKIVEKHGAKCIAIDNGIKAIEMIKIEEFDCVLMDVNMPGINGFQASERIREFNLFTPIVLLTAVNEEEIEPYLTQNIVNGFILKPFINSIFINEIETAIQNARSKQTTSCPKRRISSC